MVISVQIKDKIWNILHSVMDPEIPVISLVDLGIIREIKTVSNRILIQISPTYSGCPALDVIPKMIQNALEKEGFPQTKVEYVLDPPWSTDWISEAGKKRLLEYGIAPPPSLSDQDTPVVCPHCRSEQTKMISAFGSTPCKSMYKCRSCLEPFEQFKCL